MKYRLLTTLTFLLLAAMAGCEDEDQRLTEMAEQSLHRQQEQNELIARQSQAVTEQNQQIAEAAQQLVAKDAEARQEMIRAQEALNTQITAERSSLDRQREALEQERIEIAAHRNRDPVVAEGIRGAALLVAGLLPLLLVGYLLFKLDRSPGEKLGELLIEDVTSEQPYLLPSPSQAAANITDRRATEAPPDSVDPGDGELPGSSSA